MVAKRPTKRVTAKKPAELIRLDIACGQRKDDGWVGVDLIPGDKVDVVHDLLTFPWPFADNSVSEIRCSHFVEHIPHWRPGWTKDGWWLFWEEVHRILTPDGTIEVQHPWGRSDRAWWDPTHERAIMDMTWYYLSAEWRTNNQLDHYPVTCDFEVQVITALGVPQEIMLRAEQFQTFAKAYYTNVFQDMQVKLRAIKE